MFLYAYLLFSHLFEFYRNGTYDALCSSISRSRIQFCLTQSKQQTRLLNSTKLFRTCHFNVLSLFQRFTPLSAFYPHFGALSPFQRFTPFQRFIPHFSFRFQFPFPPFSFSVLSRPDVVAATGHYCLLSKNW